MRRARLIAAALVVTLNLGLTAPAAAAPRLSIEMGDVGTIEDDGRAAVLSVTLRCPRGGFEVLEAHATLSQGNASGMGGFGPRCGGRVRTYDVRVTSLGDPFVPGSASAGGFVLMLHTDCSTISASDAETITLQ